MRAVAERPPWAAAVASGPSAPRRAGAALALAAVLALTGCRSVAPPTDRSAPTDRPVLTPFADAADWMLWAPLRVAIGGQELTVPAGFVTDFASVPSALRGLVSPAGPHLVPSIVHDYLYWNQTCSRDQADRIFALALEGAGVGAVQREVLSQGVRTPLGRRAWRDNARDRDEGRPRIVPPGAPPPDPSETWSAYRLRLAGPAPAARGDALPDALCALGGARAPADG